MMIITHNIRGDVRRVPVPATSFTLACSMDGVRTGQAFKIQSPQFQRVSIRFYFGGKLFKLRRKTIVSLAEKQASYQYRSVNGVSETTSTGAAHNLPSLSQSGVAQWLTLAFRPVAVCLYRLEVSDSPVMTIGRHIRTLSRLK